jgi:Holliday junction resolvase-like predicted endonuclease
MKNIPPNPDGIHIVGRIVKVDPEERMLWWRPDQRRSARTLAAPIPAEVIRRFFGPGTGGAMQRLPATNECKWRRLLRYGEVVEGVPLLRVRGRPKKRTPPKVDPRVKREHGQKGERHVLKILRGRYPQTEGYKVVHAAKENPGTDHDIAIHKGSRVVRLVEVKTRVGVPGDPILISDRQIDCRRKNRGAHSIFIVYLNQGSSIRCVLEIGSRDSFALAPHQFWLTPPVA